MANSRSSVQGISLPRHGWTLVSGGIGVGKSTLVRSGDAYYGSFTPSSYSSHQGSTCCAVFRSAMQTLVENLSKEEAKRIDFEFDAADSHELTEIFPCLALFFTDNYPEQDSKTSIHKKKNYREGLESTTFSIVNRLPGDAMFRIGLPELFVRLLKAFPCLNGQFILEDWHWADTQSVDVLEALFDHRNDIKVPIVCTFRDDVPARSESWTVLLEKMMTATDTDKSFHEIKLQNWNEMQISCYLEENFSVVEELHLVSHVVHQQTQGNPLCISFFMEMLRQESIIKAPESSVDALSLDEAEVNTKLLFDPKFESSLPKTITQCIHRIAIIEQGALPTIKSLVTLLRENSIEEIHLKVLSTTSDQSVQQVECHLSRLPSFFVTLAGKVSFTHREVKSSVLAMMTKEEMAILHFQNGNRLWQTYHKTIDDHESILFLTVQQLHLGSVHNTDPAEVSVFAMLCLKAGERAMGSSHFSEARSYFNHAIEKLGAWTVDMHDALLTLHNLAAEASYAAGSFQMMDTHLNAVFEHSKSIKDSLRARCTQLFSNGARNKTTSVSDALKLLKELGADFPSNPGSVMVLKEFLKTRWVLRNKTDIDFLSLPVATDPDAVALMQALFFAFVTFYISNPKLALVVTFRLIQLTTKHGVSGPAIAAFATYSFLLVAAFGWIDEAYKYGKIALQMGEAFSARSYLARGQLSFHGYVSLWFTPYHEHFIPLKETYRLALQTGDMESAVYGCAILTDLSIHTGRPLDQVEKETRSICQAMDRLNQTAGLAITMVMYSFIVCDLLGQPFPDLNLQGPVQDLQSARSLARRSTETNVPSDYVEFLASNLQTMLLSLQGLHVESVKTAIEAYKSFQSEVNPDLMFYEGVSSLIASRLSSSTVSRIRFRQRGKRICRSFRRWAKKCPPNFHGRYSLMMAELSACRGRHLQALRWYEASIAWSLQQRLMVDQGFAHACLGDYLRDKGCHQMAKSSYRNAKAAYQKWGANTLVDYMDSILAIEVAC